jgi:hypothetical protein
MNEQLISLLERVTAAQEAQAKAMHGMAERLDLLIQALAEDEPEDPNALPLTYMDGTPCR